MRGLFTLLATVALISVGATEIVMSISFDRQIGGHLKRAADANTIELALSEMNTAVTKMEEKGLTSGYTSIVYRTPDEDIGFWYKNLKASRDELASLPTATTTPLERSNMLIKLRETLLDQGKSGVSVTAPEGISRYPNNGILLLLLVVTLIATVVSWFSLLDEY